MDARRIDALKRQVVSMSRSGNDSMPGANPAVRHRGATDA
jgi:hypothetical protein